MSSPVSDAALNELVSGLDAEIKALRTAGDTIATLAAAAAALDRLDQALAATPEPSAAAMQAARQLGMRIGYNVAADIYPGWALNTPQPPPEALKAARQLAVRSQIYVEQLGGAPDKRGNALWLLGALDLAAGARDAAETAFAQAAACFETASEMQLMAQAYAALAANDAAQLDAKIAQLAALATEDAVFLHDQLVTARHIYLSD